MTVLTSRRLWTFFVAGALSITSLIVGHGLTDPWQLQVLTTIIGFIDGLAAILIVSLTVDDTRANTAQIKAETAIQVAAIQAGTHPDFQLGEKQLPS